MSIARTGRSRKRFDMPAAAMISLRPILVSWSTFLPNSGELASSAIRSATKPSTLVSSLDFTSSETGTRPAAFSGLTSGTGSGGVRSKAVSVAVAVCVFVSLMGAGLSKRLESCIRVAIHDLQACSHPLAR